MNFYEAKEIVYIIPKMATTPKKTTAYQKGKNKI